MINDLKETRAAERVAKNTLILYGRMAITVFISLYTTRLVLHALGASDFGLYSLVAGILAMFGFLQNTMTTASQRFMSYAQGEGNMKKLHQVFNVSVLLHLITGVLIVFLLELAGNIFFGGGFLKMEPSRIQVARWIYQFAIISTFFSIVSVPFDAVLNAHENMLFNALLSVVESILKLTLALVLAYVSSDKLMVYGSSMVAISVFAVLVRVVYCRKRYQECELDFRKYYHPEVKRQMLGFAAWSSLSATTSMVAVYGQTVVLNSFFGTLVNASQSISNQVSGQLSALGTTFVTALNPVIVKSAGSGNRAFLNEATLTGTKISFFLMSVLYIPIFCEAPYLMKMWLKSPPEFAIPFLRLQLLMNLIEQLFKPLMVGIMATGNIRKFQTTTSFIYALLIPASIVFFMLGSPPHAVYLVFIAGYLLLLITTISFAKRTMHLVVSEYAQMVLKPCMIVLIIVLAISLVPSVFFEDSFHRMAGVVMLSIICFLLTVFKFGLSKREKSVMVDILKQQVVRILIKR